jgi:hypothetical protein
LKLALGIGKLGDELRIARAGPVWVPWRYRRQQTRRGTELPTQPRDTTHHPDAGVHRAIAKSVAASTANFTVADVEMLPQDAAPWTGEEGLRAAAIAVLADDLHHHSFALAFDEELEARSLRAREDRERGGGRGQLPQQAGFGPGGEATAGVERVDVEAWAALDEPSRAGLDT